MTCQSRLSVSVREKIVKHVKITLKVLASLRNIDWAVLTVQQILLVYVLEPLLFIDLLSHKMKGVILIVEVSRVLCHDRDTAHVDGQT